ncbi:hypothetical protein T265_13692, partial [Opisthorchis viverrini]
IDLVFTRVSSESLVYDVLQLNVLCKGRLTFKLVRFSGYRNIFSQRNLLTRLPKTLRQPTTGFAPLGAQEGRNRSWAVEEFSATILSQTLKSLFWSMFSQISITNLPIKKPGLTASFSNVLLGGYQLRTGPGLIRIKWLSCGEPEVMILLVHPSLSISFSSVPHGLTPSHSAYPVQQAAGLIYLIGIPRSDENGWKYLHHNSQASISSQLKHTWLGPF